MQRNPQRPPPQDCGCITPEMGRGSHTYHFEWRQDEDDVADLAAVLPPVLRPLQARDAHVAPLEVLHVAAAAQRRGRGGVTPTTHEPPPSAEEEILQFETLFNAPSQLNV